MTSWKTLACTYDGPVATVMFNQPEKRNAASNELLGELFGEVGKLRERDDLSVVLLTGAGRFFSPGADFGDVAAGDGIVMVEGEASPMYDVAAAINGGCAGAGLGLACGCDLRVATASAKFTTAFLALGVPGDMCLPWLLPNVVGPARARQLSFLPDKFGAESALEWGLVSTVFPDDEFHPGVEALVARMAQIPPKAVRAMKHNYLAAEQMSLAEYARYEARLNVANFDPSAFEQRAGASSTSS